MAMDGDQACPRPGRRTPRRITGDLAEAAVADLLQSGGWTILARNVRVGRAELDIVALDPDSIPVIVEVRSRSGTGFGAPEESVDAGKVRRLYGAARRLAELGRLPDGSRLREGPFRVDLVAVTRDERAGEWTVTLHLCGLVPPG